MKRGGFLKRHTPLKAKVGLKRSTVRLKKARTDTVGKLKKKLWSLTRQIIIQRHGDTCYTCGAVGLMGSNLHIGHFIPSSVCSAEMRYSLDNLRPQCYRDNIHRSGDWVAYEAHLIRDGIDVAELKRRNERTKGMKADVLFYQAKIAEYSALLSEL